MNNFLTIFKKTWTLVAPFHKWFYVALILTIAQKSLMLAENFFIGRVITAAGEHKGLLLLALGLAVVMAVDVITDFLFDLNWNQKLMQPVLQHLQEFSLTKILGLTVMQHKEEHSALKIDTVTRGEESIFNFNDQFLRVLVPTVVQLIISFVTLFFIEWRLGVGSLVVFLIMFAWVYSYQKLNYPRLKQNRDNWREQNKFKQEAYTHLESVKILAREDFFVAKYLAGREERVRFQKMFSLRNNINDFFRSGFMSASRFAALAFGLWLYMDGQFAIGTVYFVFATVQSVLNQVSWLNMAIREIPQSYANIEKYFEIVDIEPAFNEGGKKLGDYNQGVSFNDVSFKYPQGDHVALDHASFVIEKGKTTAFVGHSGSGKTTIARLLLRSYPYSEGSIKVGENELNEIDAHDLRERVGYVEQHVDLFDDTVRENILIGVDPARRDEVDARIDEIAKRARISEFAYRLGDTGYDTIVGERGVKLSGGERQRVGIARALAKDPDIYIFDEATASLDAINEKGVMDAFYDAASGKTTVVIAHRLSTVRNADKIIMMEKGKVVALGTHDELMKASPKYQDLVRHQIEE